MGHFSYITPTSIFSNLFAGSCANDNRCNEQNKLHLSCNGMDSSLAQTATEGSLLRENNTECQKSDQCVEEQLTTALLYS